MEKKSSSNNDIDSIQIYKPVQFGEDITPPKYRNQEIKEEDIQARIKALEDEGYQKGYAIGYEKGLKDSEKDVAQRLKRFEGIITELEAYKLKKTNELMPLIIELSMEIASKVIHKEVELDRNIVMYIARDAIKKIEENEDNVVIKVNPLDYEVIAANINLLKEQSGLKNISIEPLSTISPGGCYIETQTAEVDSRIEEQIKEIHDAISTATDIEV
ncbi:type III secretion system protein [Dissulfurispira thermophila]|uniref:Flagellar assembly protein FliH n=1 Tax=Dissulfurispira thermophila TaxID=2715679 RepID=A0A7G1H2P9_9BACT|nr:FliH/SctL family protein [Dissulfurispira thermophila]BCB96472.1 type III secretion system protein [Dissulfurispira thermophila]